MYFSLYSLVSKQILFAQMLKAIPEQMWNMWHEASISTQKHLFTEDKWRWLFLLYLSSGNERLGIRTSHSHQQVTSVLNVKQCLCPMGERTTVGNWICGCWEGRNHLIYKKNIFFVYNFSLFFVNNFRFLFHFFLRNGNFNRRRLHRFFLFSWNETRKKWTFTLDDNHFTVHRNGAALTFSLDCIPRKKWFNLHAGREQWMRL